VAFIGLAPIAALGFAYVGRARRPLGPVVVTAALVVMVPGGATVRSGDNIRLPGAYIPSAGPRAATTDVVSAARWLEARYGPHLTVMGDLDVVSIFAAYARSRPASYQNYGFRPWEVFFGRRLSARAVSELERSKTDFIAIDRRITQLPPFGGFYFSAQEPVTARPLPTSFLTKFERSRMFTAVYDNGNVVIYRYLGKPARRTR
jgi:hypothetical protein